MREGLTFDDVLLVPKQGVLNSRKDADISSELVSGIKLEVPIVSANMPSVTGPEMAKAMDKAGGISILHRFSSVEENVQEYKETFIIGNWNVPCSFGIGKDNIKRINKLYDVGCRTFCLDVAHADSYSVIEAVYFFKQYREDAKLIAGNVATLEGANRLLEAGADAIKIGIGPGAACRTREVTGFGVPQLTAIMDIAGNNTLRAKFPDARFIADGGIKTSGDIVKALAAGADTVMIGSLLAGCDEAPNPGEYYGNAAHKVNGHRAPEGSYGKVERRGSVEDVIKELAWGIRSGVSYGGATNLEELRRNAEFIKITATGQHENQTRILPQAQWEKHDKRRGIVRR